MSSIKLKIGTLKAASKPDAKAAAKSRSELIKRLVVGFMVLACYVSPMYIHPLVYAVFANDLLVFT